MTNRDAIYVAWRAAWPGLLSLFVVTAAMALLFAFIPELSGAEGERVNRWSVLAWLFLGFINVSHWMRLICQAKGQPENARWWIAAPTKAALALVLATLIPA